ncbi:hypothetical protein [Halogeometricum limi]|uniref:DUF7967 domain-containing protein n=1 Tax=Halogeometricum limi TaxID=555875 RepID=A0A1I6ICL5_9EURY|nr:hypothetical protein [Halogeometricum limi]SFR64472.1 hypothetical protein SAMN04488124_3048 [Halogeometricum limi]
MADTIRCWFVERGYNDRDLIILTYATPEGDRIFTKELAAQVIDSKTVTAAEDVDPDNLETVDDVETRERYAQEAKRVASEHDPDDEL